MRIRQLAGFAGRSCRCQGRGLQRCYRRTSGCNLPVLILGSARRREKKRRKKKKRKKVGCGGGGGGGGGLRGTVLVLSVDGNLSVGLSVVCRGWGECWGGWKFVSIHEADFVVILEDGNLSASVRLFLLLFKCRGCKFVNIREPVFVVVL